VIFLVLATWINFFSIGLSKACVDIPACDEETLQSSTGDYVAQLISIEAGSEDSLIAYLTDCLLPVWKRMHTEDTLLSLFVFELSSFDPTLPTNSMSEYLVLAELGLDFLPADLHAPETSAICQKGTSIPEYHVMRSAYMTCTQRSCYGNIDPEHKDGEVPMDYFIEFIGVENTPDQLAKYHELMGEYFGPANGKLVERGMLHCFIALENKEVLSTTPETIPWNQIHISDDWSSEGDIDWDAVYTELFRSEFSVDLDSIWAELPSTDNSRNDCRGRLILPICIW
jgi:hypothetical protein